jgi:predicted transcriptional regulator
MGKWLNRQAPKTEATDSYPKKLLIGLTVDMRQKLEEVCKVERRNGSEAIREALRQYFHRFDLRQMHLGRTFPPADSGLITQYELDNIKEYE